MSIYRQLHAVIISIYQFLYLKKYYLFRSTFYAWLYYQFLLCAPHNKTRYMLEKTRYNYVTVTGGATILSRLWYKHIWSAAA